MAFETDESVLNPGTLIASVPYTDQSWNGAFNPHVHYIMCILIILVFFLAFPVFLDRFLPFSAVLE